MTEIRELGAQSSGWGGGCVETVVAISTRGRSPASEELRSTASPVTGIRLIIKLSAASVLEAIMGRAPWSMRHAAVQSWLAY